MAPLAFEFTAPGRIVFGRGRFSQIAPILFEFGSRVLVLRAGAHLEAPGVLGLLRREAAAIPLLLQEIEVHGEPTVEGIDGLLDQARRFGAEVILGIGGGSVLDTAKALAGLLTNHGEVLDFLEVIGKGRPLERPALPLVAVPTTAGTGSEGTRNSVLTSRRWKVKASLRSPHLLPKVALVDPALTDGLPAALTHSTGLDALTQLVEAYLTKKASPFTDALALDGARRAGQALRRLFLDGTDQAARDEMSLAALQSGLCLANAGLGAVHGLAAALGGKTPVPHGVACGRLLPLVLQANLVAARGQDLEDALLDRVAELSAALTGLPVDDRGEPIEHGLAFVRDLVQNLGIPGLAAYGVTEAELPELVAASLQTSSMKQNPVALDAPTLVEILRQAL